MRYPFAYISSATGLGGRWEGSYPALADDLVAGGWGTVLLMDRYASKEQVDYLKGKGLAVWAWEEPGFGISASNGRFQEMGYDGLVLQTENPGQRDAALAEFRAGLAAGKERHVVSYYFGFDDGHGADYWRAFKAAGVSKFQVECYAADGHTDAKAYMARAVQLGIPAEDVVCVFGTYRGEKPSSYANADAAGPGFGVYIVDNWPDASMGDPALTFWKEWGALNKTAPAPEPTPMPTNDAAARNAQVASITKTWLDSFGPAPLSRMACEHDIAVSTDDIWYSRRQDVRDALDGKVAALRESLASAEAAQAEATSNLNAALAKLASAEAALDAASKKIEAARSALG